LEEDDLKETLKGMKVVIGTDVQGEEVREKLEMEVEMLGGEISIRSTIAEDWEKEEEDGDEKRKVVLICWRKDEGREVELVSSRVFPPSYLALYTRES